MNIYTPVREWADPLRSLALGVSIATFFLVPTTSNPVVWVEQESVQKKVDLVTTIPDGAFFPDRAFDLRTIHIRTRSGLETPFLPIPIQSTEDKIESDNIPYVLRDITDLPVETLASLVGVSRNAYYKWLDGKGVSNEHVTRLTELLDTFRTLYDLLGSGIKEFLETVGPAGKPIDLLASGDNSAVIGLALRPLSNPIASLNVSDVARHISGLSGWLRPAVKLGWNAPDLTSIEHVEALDQLNPILLPNEEKPLSDADKDDESFVAWGFFLE